MDLKKYRPYLQTITENVSLAEAASKNGVSKQYVHKLGKKFEKIVEKGSKKEKKLATVPLEEHEKLKKENLELKFKVLLKEMEIENLEKKKRAELLAQTKKSKS